jgi:hypothetical protein
MGCVVGAWWGWCSVGEVWRLRGGRDSGEGAGTSRGRPRMGATKKPVFRERRCAVEGAMRRRGAPEGRWEGKFYNHEISENNASHTFSRFFYVDYIIFSGNHCEKWKK